MMPQPEQWFLVEVCYEGLSWDAVACFKHVDDALEYIEQNAAPGRRFRRSPMSLKEVA